MPLFLARWPAGWVTLVKAASEDDALFILDEDADTTGVTVTRYRGPFVIDFAVDAKYDVAESADQGEPLPPTAISVIDAGALEYPSTSLKPQIPEGPTAEQMLARIVRLGFPAVAKVQRRRRKPKPGELEAALREDLQSVVSTSWRHASLARRVEKINRRATQTGARSCTGRMTPSAVPRSGRSDRRRQDRSDEERSRVSVPDWEGTALPTLEQVDDASIAQLPAMLAFTAAVTARIASRLLKFAPSPRVEDRLLLIGEAAELLAKSEGWLYHHAKELPFTRRVGRGLRFSRVGIRQYLDAQATTGGPIARPFRHR